MKNTRLIALLGTVLVLLAASCKKESACRAVFGEGVTLNLEEPKWHDLNTPGNPVMVNRGLKGIYVTRMAYSGEEQFAALECACPNDNDICLLADTEANFPDRDDHYGTSVLRCPKCNATFEAVYGQPLEGQHCPLYRYATVVDGYNLIIY